MRLTQRVLPLPHSCFLCAFFFSAVFHLEIENRAHGTFLFSVRYFCCYCCILARRCLKCFRDTQNKSNNKTFVCYLVCTKSFSKRQFLHFQLFCLFYFYLYLFLFLGFFNYFFFCYYFRTHFCCKNVYISMLHTFLQIFWQHFQSYLFWLHSARLLIARSTVRKTFSF